jgi:hypothetical protein
MKESYDLVCPQGSTDSNCRHYENYEVAQPVGLITSGSNDYHRYGGINILGGIFYSKAGQRFDYSSGAVQMVFRTNTSIIGSVVYIQQNNIKPVMLNFSNYKWQRSTLYNYSGLDFGYRSAVLPTTYNGMHYQSITIGYSGTIEPNWPANIGGTVADNQITWRNEGPMNLAIENCSFFGRNSTEIDGMFSQSNIIKAATPGVFYFSGENIFNTQRGAKICYRYENGQLTNKPLWPWPMEQRIIDAMRYAGYPEDKIINVTADIEAMFGKIPDECRS